MRATPPFESAARRNDGVYSPQCLAGSCRLTPRQIEVLSLLSEGLPNKLISRRLNIAASTVKVHMANILRELGVSNRLQAVISAHRYGLLDVASGLNTVTRLSEQDDGTARVR